MRQARVLVLLASAFGGFALAAACSAAGPEQQILTTFFRASRVRDNATLANLSAVSFDPRTDGTVQDFTVTSVGTDEKRPMQIRSLMQEEEAARQADADFSTRKRAYQDANLEAIQRVMKAEAAKQTLRGKDAEVQAAWAKWRDDQSRHQKRLSDARERLSNERALAVSSLTAPGRADVDVSGMDVELVTRQVTVNAQVRDPNGQTTPKTFIFTLQRANGKTSTGEQQEGRWMITAIKPAGAPPSK